MEKELALLEKKMEEFSFWDNKQDADITVKRVSELKSWVKPLKKIITMHEDIASMYTEIEKLGDQELLQQMEDELINGEKILEELEARRCFTRKEDANSCYISVNAGAGGTESCDWALMLSRMYLRYIERKGWKSKIVSELSGDVAGIKNIMIHVDGSFAYGFLRGEAGVHRLVRISPFDSNAKRHTSFASVEVVPEIGDDIDVTIKSEDIRVDTFRASGAGGQHVNTTDSAVRMTHIKTGIVVSSQQERSQIKNRDICMKMLKSALYKKMLEEKKEEISQLSAEKMQISFGSQIRNYVMHPYTLVKDTRTKMEKGDVGKVLDGDLDSFIISFLKMTGG